jgi:hypothetical protein
MESFATMWNRKYPSTGYLMAATPTINENTSLRDDVLSIRTPQGWNLEHFLNETWKEKLRADIVKVFKRNLVGKENMASSSPTTM